MEHCIKGPHFQGTRKHVIMMGFIKHWSLFGCRSRASDEGDAEDALLCSERDGRFDEAKMSKEGKQVYPPLLPLKTLPNMVLAHVSIHLDIQGENGCWAGEDEAGWTAIWSAYWAIAEGRSSLAILCGSESFWDWHESVAITDNIT